MNATVLGKCIEELKKETPDLSYIRGMLETLQDMISVASTPIYPSSAFSAPITRTESIADEEIHNDALNAYLGGPTGTVTN